MKLIQYRFSHTQLIHCKPLAKSILNFLFETEDTDIRLQYTDSQGALKFHCGKIDSSGIEDRLTKTMEQSLGRTRYDENYITIRSNKTCRFIVVEDDLLIRICHAHSDELIDFEFLEYIAEDVSNLLIMSDMFDWSAW